MQDMEDPVVRVLILKEKKDPDYLDIPSRKVNVSGNDYRNIFGLKRLN
jgi:hypothetical protein